MKMLKTDSFIGKNICVYDIETNEKIPQNKDLSKMTFACGSVYSYRDDKILFFTNIKEFFAFIETHNYSISFNGLNFDRLILKNQGYELTAKEIDILNLFFLDKRFYCKLDIFGEINFGIKKLFDGSAIPALIKEKKWDIVKEYNARDVTITKLLFDMILEGKPIRFKTKAGDGQWIKQTPIC